MTLIRVPHTQKKKKNKFAGINKIYRKHVVAKFKLYKCVYEYKKKANL